MAMAFVGGEWIAVEAAPPVGASAYGGSIPPASTQRHPYIGGIPMPSQTHDIRPENQPHKLTTPIPEVTWAWGEAYPCRFPIEIGKIGGYCSGRMIPRPRCFRYEGRGRLWRHFDCSMCKRHATDWKVRALRADRP